MTYKPREGSRTELGMAALERGPMTSLELSDAMDCDQKQITGIMASAITHGAVLVDRAVTPFVYRLAGSAAVDRLELQRSAADPAPAPAAPSPAPVRAPRSPRNPPAELVREAVATTRFGIFSDGVIVIESGPARIELQAAEAAKLRRLLEVAA